MSGIKIYVSDRVEELFRKKAMEVFGYSKGSLSLAAEEAFNKWVRDVAGKNHLVEKTVEKDPVAAIRGMLAGKTTKSAVELQHSRGEITYKQYLKDISKK